MITNCNLCEVHLEKVICSSLVVRLIRVPLTSNYLITAINECPLVSGVQTLYNRLFQVKAGTVRTIRHHTYQVIIHDE